MSKTNGSVLDLWSRVVRMKGVGDEKVVPKGGKTTDEQASSFHQLYEGKDDTVDGRKSDASAMTDTFYDLVTDFYESGWGQCFHFAPRGENETFRESLARHEHYISSAANINAKDIVLDCGCGIGGPMRNIAQFTNADITGITINSYQIKRGNSLNKAAGLEKIARCVEMDYTKMTFEDNSFDKIFAIESTCHCGVREDVFSEIYRVLKPGGLFATYEWLMVDGKYDPKNAAHIKARQEVEKGNALPELIGQKQAEQALQNVGFEMILSRDLADPKNGHGPIPWYASMEAKCTLENVQHSQFAMYLTHALCWTMEKVGLAPKGTVKTHEILLTARDGLVAAGQMGIFTPMHILVGRKPLK